MPKMDTKLSPQMWCLGALAIVAVLFVVSMILTKNFDGAFENNTDRDRERALYCGNLCTPLLCSHPDVKNKGTTDADYKKHCKDGKWKDVGVIDINYWKAEAERND